MATLIHPAPHPLPSVLMQAAVLPACPLLTVTGIPCPFCGGTRAFISAAQGDLGGVLEANAVWVLYAAVVVVLVLWQLLQRRPVPGVPGPLTLALLALPAWGWAIATQST